MAYLGLARKWRPQTFDDLIGQSHISITLLNAIKTGRVIQGYLFTGTRGIGKTSAARILAKALRCSTPTAPGIPCNQCTDCKEIAEGRSVDVLEIDGASNNGVDAIREIRENVKYLPSKGSKKIYIIDEVHMLTTAAFNALLKTLEEPPVHVIFIFATTDVQKIPETVLSRCQRFDFKRVSEKQLRDHLQKICLSENISITNDALGLLAREADGSMRDALSLLDQALSVGDKQISSDLLIESFGLIDKKTVLDCITAILKQEPLKAIDAVGNVYLHGFDLKQFGRELLRYLRIILITKLLVQEKKEASPYLDLSDTDQKDVQDLIGLRSSEDIDMLFHILSNGLEDVVRSTMPKIVLDMLMIKMACAEELICVSALAHDGFAEKKSVTENISAVKQPTPLSSETWAKAVYFIKAQKPLIGSILENMGLESVEQKEQALTIYLTHTKEQNFHCDQLQSKSYQDTLNSLLKSYFGRAVRLEFLQAKANNSFESLEEKQRRIVLQNEVFRSTEQLLGATLEKLEIKSLSEGE